MITAAGLTIVGLTGGGRGAGRSSLAALIAVESAVFALGAGLVVVSTHRSVQQRREGLLLATAAGALFGVSDVAVKYLTHAHGPVLGLISPWTLTAVVSFVVSFSASARSLQVGLPIELIAITSVTANLAAILGGIVIFGESIGSGAVGITGRMLAFLLVIVGAAMTPAQTHTPAQRNAKPAQPSERSPPGYDDSQADNDPGINHIGHLQRPRPAPRLVRGRQGGASALPPSTSQGQDNAEPGPARRRDATPRAGWLVAKQRRAELGRSQAWPSARPAPAIGTIEASPKHWLGATGRESDCDGPGDSDSDAELR
jgi:hypothetical protein